MIGPDARVEEEGIMRSPVRSFAVVGLVLSVLGAACAGAPSAVAPSAAPQGSAAAAPTAASVPASLTLAVNLEPNTASVWEPLFGNGSQMLRDLVSDPLTWYDAKTREPVPTGITTKWEQMAANRWRFYLRPGVKFHNGEPWNADAAAFGLSVLGDPAIGHESYQYAGTVKGVVVDDMT